MCEEFNWCLEYVIAYAMKLVSLKINFKERNEMLDIRNLV